MLQGQGVLEPLCLSPCAEPLCLGPCAQDREPSIQAYADRAIITLSTIAIAMIERGFSLKCKLLRCTQAEKMHCEHIQLP